MRRKRIASGPEGACRPKRSGSMQPARRKLRGALWRARRDRVVLQKRRRQWHARCGPKASERVWSVRHAGKRLGVGERLVRPELLPKQPPSDPAGPASGTIRILRGGSWAPYPKDVRVSFRYHVYPVGMYAYGGGLRCTGEANVPWKIATNSGP